jgi:2'-5' RNA ligase
MTHAARTHKTAAVLMPPEQVWEPIQAIRRVYDDKIRRWMPHVTLLYPFPPRESFDTLTPAIARACENVSPFPLTLESFRFFDHGHGRYTLWLAPEPMDELIQLQEKIRGVVVDQCGGGDAGGHSTQDFTPHLSIGRIQGRERLDELLERLPAQWRPLTFTANRLSLLWRDDPPEDVFRVDRTVHLGGPLAMDHTAAGRASHG